MEDLKIINADNLLYTSLNESEFIIEEILPVGLHIFCGAPKVGKSWLMLDLCIKVSKGEELWNLQCKQCDFLYLALEDTYQRLQKRLFKLTDEIGSNFHIAIESNKITNGLVMQLEQATEADYEDIKCSNRFNGYEATRISAWKSIQCGSCGYTYGGNGIWASCYNTTDNTF